VPAIRVAGRRGCIATFALGRYLRPVASRRGRCRQQPPQHANRAGVRQIRLLYPCRRGQVGERCGHSMWRATRRDALLVPSGSAHASSYPAGLLAKCGSCVMHPAQAGPEGAGNGRLLGVTLLVHRRGLTRRAAVGKRGAL